MASPAISQGVMYFRTQVARRGRVGARRRDVSADRSHDDVVRTANALRPPSRSLLLALAAAAPLASQDWPMWGGTPARNMSSPMTGLPATWDIKTNDEHQWKAELGSTSYGNPVVADGKVFVGTNNDSPRNPQVTGDKGVLMCFRETDGAFLWQAVSDKLEAGKSIDWPEQGVCSSPAVDGKRLYYVTNRGELVCLDTEGFADGENDGPFQDETVKGPTDADVVWKLDMIKELGVFPHNMSNSSPLVWEDLVFVETSNGRDDEPRARCRRRRRRASSRSTGHRQGRVAGQLAGRRHPARAVVVAGARRGQRRRPGGLPGRRRLALRASTRRTGDAALAVRPEPEGRRLAEDAATTASPRRSSTAAGSSWRSARIRRAARASATCTASTRRKTRRHHRDRPRVAVRQDPAVDLDGGRRERPALSSPTSAASCTASTRRPGKPYWTFDMLAAVWGSPLVADGKVYLGDEDGDVVVLQAGPGDEEARRDQHGERRLRRAGARQRRALHHEPFPAVRDRVGPRPPAGERRRTSGCGVTSGPRPLMPPLAAIRSE